MAKVGAQRAAELTGKSKSTIQRAMNSGKISYELDNNGRRVIDVSELERAFGLKQETQTTSHKTSIEQELEKASFLLEKERLQMRVKMLEEQLYSAEQNISDLKEQRDKWQKQADQVLLTSQHAQKQADELRDEMKEREKRAQERRQQKLEERMKRMNAENQNKTRAENNEEDDETTLLPRMQGFLNKFKRSA